MPVKHVIQQGECLSSIAKAYGFDDWHVIYDDPANSAFKEEHPNPNLIHPGEELTIPDLDPGKQSASTEKKNKYQLTSDKTLLRIVVQDMQDQVFANKPYRLMLGGELPLAGTTGGDGLIEAEVVPAIETARLEVFIHGQNEPPAVWDLLIGHLDPCKQKSGQQARLNNLGFESGTVDNIDGPVTQGAVKRFQAKYGLKVDGIVGSQTRPKMEQVYGC
jgi:N-acetylmuramoyl-L-alanine amidase